MPARISLLDDQNMAPKAVPIGVDFWLRNNNEFRLNQWTFSLSTADATPTLMLAENADLLNNTAYAFHGLVVARYSAASTAGAYVIQGCVKRGAEAANTSLVGTPLITAYEDTAGMDLGITANTTAGRLNLTATGVAATTILWSATIRWLAV